MPSASLKPLLFLLPVLIVAGCSAAETPAASAHDSVTYEIRVVDELSRPIAGATVWVLGQATYRTDLRPADLARLVRRYSADVDFIFTGDVHGFEWVLRTGTDGAVRYTRPDKDVHGLPRVRTSFAGLKRGFRPAQVDDDAPNNSRRQILLRLQAESGAAIDPRMDEFDRIRARANPGNDVDDPMATHRKLDREDDTRLRALAAALENDGRPDDAAAIYYNLAYLPSVDGDSEETSAGIARAIINGLSGSEPRSIADLERAWLLARGHPMLEYDAMMTTYLGQGLELMSEKGVQQRRAYLAEAEKLIQKYGERLRPYDYGGLEWAHVANGEFEAGCSALRTFHDFDPSIADAKTWTRYVEDFQHQVRQHGGPAKMPCEIEGVPAPGS